MSSDGTSSDVTVTSLTELLTGPADGMMMLPSRACDQVFPGVFLGEEGIARSPANLTRLGVTHVLNTAEGENDHFHVTADANIYQPAGIRYRGFKASDDANCDISSHFRPCADYIEEALSNKGKVMVHCKLGSSRSAAIVLAYLMLKRHLPAPEAVSLVRSKREICPNDGFLQQLCDLNEQLLKAGHFEKRNDTQLNEQNTEL